MSGRGPALLGVRHHGPGSARAVRAALDLCAPRAVLVEGPPEADAIVHLAADEGMRPPVALLAHAVDDPGRSVFWPLAAFSPEWTAIRWALAHGVPVRFIDLPAARTLALRDQEQLPGDTSRKERADPLAALAEAAGHDDPERWWEDAVEHRGTSRAGDALAPFRALAEAMAELRSAHGDDGGRDAAREAHMRLKLREARREFGDAVAVVCGAWHVPALTEKRTVAADRAELKGLPKARTELSWVPWTHRRLARHSGYGAGIESPGWYGHLFHAPDRPVERWMTEVARLLRAEDHPVSPAHVIEAVRLADTLAALRGRPLAGLTETLDAVRSVMCDGSDAPLALVEERLVIGDDLGEVPDSAPATPLRRDLTRLQRTLRLKPEAAARDRELDLRKDTDAARSRLLHRLRLLGVDWGEPVRPRSGTGTFRETWRLCWEPELSVRVAEAGAWGTTVEAAATAKAEAEAARTPALAGLTTLAERCLLAGLPDALPTVMRALADRAALDADVAHLASALPALVRSVRYGDVRRTDTAALGEVAAGLAERVFVGLPAACAGLDADAAADMRGHLDAVHHAVGLLAGPGPAVAPGIRERWAGVLRLLAGRDGLPGGIRGRATRLLLDDGGLTRDRAALLMGLALSGAVVPVEAAAWIEGFLGEGYSGGMLLVHDERLRGLVDAWLVSVPPLSFTGVLPLLRRTFSAYGVGVRRALGELVRRGGAVVSRGASGFGAGVDEARAAAVVPVLRVLLGVGAGAGAADAGLFPTPPLPEPGASPRTPLSSNAGRADSSHPDPERLRRWRLVLGGDAGGDSAALRGDDVHMDRTLDALYGDARGGAGLGGSAPYVARWLGDIRSYFPVSVVQVMQRDAIDRLGLSTLLLEPEMLEAVEADVHLVGTLLSLGKVMPETTRESARAVVRKVVQELEKRLTQRTRAVVGGALDRSARVSRPRHRDIDWDRTIRANLKNYLPAHRTVVPERLVGHGRAARSVRKEVILCIDQSGSMAASVVHSAVFGAVLASMRSLDTRLVVFDTAVVDLTDRLADPVEVLFGTRLGGGTDINRALAYCQSRITRPAETVVVLISDLYEGGIRHEMIGRVAAMKASGVSFVTLLALSDEGAPAYDRDHAAALAALGTPAFGCTPDHFPEVMAAALEKRPLPVPEP